MEMWTSRKKYVRGTIGHCRRRPDLGRLVVSMINLMVIDMICTQSHLYKKSLALGLKQLHRDAEKDQVDQRSTAKQMPLEKKSIGLLQSP
jgi:hypothetical protein